MDFNVLQQFTMEPLSQAINIYTIKKAIAQKTESVANVIDILKNSNTQIMESSITPHKGSNIDIKI